MIHVTLEQRYKRKANINSAEKNNRTYKERCRLHGYIAGKAVYDLAGYTEEGFSFPEQNHYHVLKCMAESGVKMLELHTTWENKEYLKRFVKLCHYFEMKVIPYISLEFPKEIEKRMELLSSVSELLSLYSFDGICHHWRINENNGYELELEDLIATVYTEVKKQNGVYALRCEKNMKLVENNKECDFIWSQDEEKEDCFAKNLPFMTFPFLKQEWIQNEEYEQTYRDWRKYLALYSPMVTENSVVYINLRDSAEICSSIPEDVYVSLFVNEETYMVVSNLTDKEYKLTLCDLWSERESGISEREFLLDAGDIILLVKSN